jgi:hypothetical protein
MENLYQFIDDEDEINAQETIKKNEALCEDIRKQVEKEEITITKSIKKAQIEVKNENDITRTTIIDIATDNTIDDDKYLDLDKIRQMYDEKPRTEKIKDSKIVLCKEFNDIKEYIHKHIVHTFEGCYYIKMGKKWVNKTETELESIYLSKFPHEVRDWFKKENTRLYKVVSQVDLPTGINVIQKNGRSYYYLNTFAGFIHKKCEFDKMDDELKQKVNIFLQYIKEVLADNNDESFEYIVKWYANVCQGKKNDTVLYLRGPEGIGKSTMTEMMINYVLGNKICTLSDTTPLVTKNNGIWIGKIFIVFEEFPTMSENMWNYCSCKLKTIVTEKYSLYGEMYTKQVQLKNIHNLVMNTNVDAIKDSNGRRVACLDVSTKFKQNHTYFANLRNNCYNIEVGNALFNYFLQVDTSKFSPQRDMPMTTNKLDAIINNLPIEIQFLKDFILFNNNDGIYKPDELYEKFLVYLMEIDYKRTKNKIKFIRGLRENGINFETGHARVNHYHLYRKTLLPLFEKNNWIHELDYEKIKDTNNEQQKPKQKGSTNIYKFANNGDSDIEEEPKKIEEPDNKFEQMQSEYNAFKKKYITQKFKNKILKHEIKVINDKLKYEITMQQYMDIFNNFLKLRDTQVESISEGTEDISDNESNTEPINNAPIISDVIIKNDNEEECVDDNDGDDSDVIDCDEQSDSENDESNVIINTLVKNAATSLLLCFD